MASNKLKEQTRFELYKITCTVSGKLYIGLTSKSAEHRWAKGHLPAALRGMSATPLARSIRKYGAENFTVEVIGRARSFEAAKKREVALIKALNTLAPDGMNATPGGEGLSACIPEVVARIRATSIKNWQRKEYRAQHKAAMQEAVKKPGYKKARSEAAKDMWSRETYCAKQQEAFVRSAVQRKDSAKKMWGRPGYREQQNSESRKEKGRIAAMKRWHPEEWARLHGSIKVETPEQLRGIIMQLTQGAKNAG